MPTNEHVVRKFFEGFWNAGGLELAEELMAADHVHHIADLDVHGPDGVKELVTSLRQALVAGSGRAELVRWAEIGPHTSRRGGHEMNRKYIVRNWS